MLKVLNLPKIFGWIAPPPGTGTMTVLQLILDAVWLSLIFLVDLLSGSAYFRESTTDELGSQSIP